MDCGYRGGRELPGAGVETSCRSWWKTRFFEKRRWVDHRRWKNRLRSEINTDAITIPKDGREVKKFCKRL
jgi:hypothetical protein